MVLALVLANPPLRAEPGASGQGAEPQRVRLSDIAELEQLVELYMAGQYERCTKELGALLDPRGPAPFRDAGVIERGRLYLSSCALLAGNRETARAALKAALEANPLMSAPDSLTFPPPVVSLYLEVRDEVETLIAKREQEQLAELRRQAEEAALAERQRDEEERLLFKLASEETVVAHGSRVVASLPFGAGQFQNGATALGITFLASEVLLSATVITSAAIFSEYRTYQYAPGTTAQQRAGYDASATVAVTSTLLLLGVTALGIVEANLSFAPQRIVGIRTRKLPPELERKRPREPTPPPSGSSIRPILHVDDQGALFGVSGTF